MPDFQHKQHGDQVALKAKHGTIAYEPNALMSMNTADQHDQRLKILPFGAIKRIRELKLNRKRSKHKKKKRIPFKQHGIIIKNLMRIKKTGVRDQVNFIIATCNIQSLHNKELQVSELIQDYSLDALVLTETWLSNKDKNWKDTSDLNKHNLQLLTLDRTKGRGGGLVLITKKHYETKCIANHNSRLKTFECTTWQIKAKQAMLTIHGVYHPPYSLINKNTNTMFIDEFTELTTELMPEYNNNILTGDFNLHVHDENDNDSAIFNDIIEAMGLVQHVGIKIHRSGNILDLMISEIQGNTTIKTINARPYLSDHCVIIVSLKTKRDPPSSKVKLIRGTNRITEQQWCDEFQPNNVQLTSNLDESMHSLNTELKRVLDTLAPEKEKRVSLKTKHPWYDQEMKTLKRHIRKLEKKWLKYRLDSCWTVYKKARNSYYYKLNHKKKDMIRHKISECGSDSRKLHKLINNLTKPREEQQWPKHTSDEELANTFASYFENKILQIRKALETTPPFKTEQEPVPKLKTSTNDKSQKCLK